MRYQVYIYKSPATTANAPAIDMCNHAVSTNSVYAWKENEAARFMSNFDTAAISERIQELVGDRCHIYTQQSPKKYGDVEYLCVSTTYAYAPTVLPYVHCVTSENDLVLYDAERKAVFFRELVNQTFITVKTRIDELVHAILAEMKPVWTIRKIGVSTTDRDHDYCYVVTLRKDSQKSFADRCAEFYACLKKHLDTNEALDTRHECFTIVGEWYSISFCLEAYKKHPNMMGYYEGKFARVKLIRRIGCDEAFRWLKENNKSVNRVRERMNFYEMERAYPNPADRFAASVNITKWEARQEEVRYCGIGMYGSEILFHTVPSDFYKDGDNISVLAIEEYDAEPILTIIDAHYPYFGERYYLEENHLPVQMWRKIVEDCKTQKQKYCNAHNFKKAKLLDIFIRWSEAQLYRHEFSCEGRMLNIQGP